MADIVVTAANVGAAEPGSPGTVIHTYQAAAAVTRGQSVYLTSAGKVNLTDADAAGTSQFLGITLQPASVGQGVDVLERGVIEGFTLTDQAYGAKIFVSGTAGALADAAGSTSSVVGTVIAANDRAKSKVLKVAAAPAGYFV